MTDRPPASGEPSTEAYRCGFCGSMVGSGHSALTEPTPEALRNALEEVLDVWPAPSPEAFYRLHRLLTGHDSCDEAEARATPPSLDVEQIVRDRLADLRSCNHDDNCSIKAEVIETVLEDIEYERARLTSKEER